MIVGELFAKSSPTPLQKLSHEYNQMGFQLYRQTVGARSSLTFAIANEKVAKRRCGNEKHHGVVFEPHRDRAAASPTKTLPVKRVLLIQNQRWAHGCAPTFYNTTYPYRDYINLR